MDSTSQAALARRRDPLTRLLRSTDKERPNLIRRTLAAASAAEKTWTTPGDRPRQLAATASLLLRTWATSVIAAHAHARALARAAGLDPLPRVPPPTPTSQTFSRILSDIRKAAAPTDDPAADTRRTARSAKAGAATAASAAFNETLLADLAASGATHAVWVTRFRTPSSNSRGTCPACAALHGTVVPLGSEFPGSATFGDKPIPTFGSLKSPPRHPNCGCSLIPLPPSIEGRSSISSMRAFATRWALAAPDMAPSTTRTTEASDTAKSTEFLTAADIRGTPRSWLRRLTATLKAALSSPATKAAWRSNANDQNPIS
jgi:hypothetical protein